MKQNVVLSIVGRQSYLDQEPEQLELVTEGVLEDRGNAGVPFGKRHGRKYAVLHPGRMHAHAPPR